ncbi:MAG TPA: hypothetical protein VJ165_04710 [candidate division Zixibacteria bacterium]|nr:hypothetical protein [candidate division Zixibacteria bacterium]
MPLVKLDPESNPEYSSLIKGYNSLLDRWNEINLSLHKFKVPKIFLFKTENKLFNIGRNLKSLQKDYLEWQGKATGFYLNPHYKFEAGTANDLAYLHYTNVLSNRLLHLELIMQLINNNYNLMHYIIDNRINFLIAITGLMLGLSGLFVTFFC